MHRVIAVVVGIMMSTVAPSDAQRAGRRVVTLDVLAEHPLFFHGEEVVIQTEAEADSVLTYLVDGDSRLLVLDVPPPPPGTRDALEVIGTFYDVGRLGPDDPRAIGQPFERLSESLLGKAWPTIGELRLVVASSSRPAPRPPGATLRTVALDPEAYVDQEVTVTGRFRGRNLYGDLPDSPGESRYDFVLTSANAAVWVVGQEPKGDDFELDVQARIDTGRWLEVSGTVRVHEGMAVIAADAVDLSEPAETPPPVETRVHVRQGPPPDVVFSTPLDGDTDVPTDTMVRIQFSRDMQPESFQGRVRVRYTMPVSGATDGGRPDITFQSAYRALNRVLEIRFEEPLAQFTGIEVQLLDGILSNDGVSFDPWSLSFFSGQ